MRFRHKRLVGVAALLVAGLALQAGAASVRAVRLPGPARGSIAWSNPHHAYVTWGTVSAPDASVKEISLDPKPGPTLLLGGARTRFCQLSSLAMGPQGNLYLSGSFGSDCLNYVDGIEIFAPGAHGNVAPIAMISGKKTLLGASSGLAFDSAGQLYVTQFFGGSNQGGAINVFAAGATGNIAPIASISGSNTLLSGPAYVIVDDAGEIFVGCGPTNQLLKFPAGATGNVAPIASVGLPEPGNGFNELQVSGNTVYASLGDLRRNTPGIYEFSTANLSPTGVLTNPKFVLVSADVDSAGNVYVQNFHRSRGDRFGIGHFYEFAAGQSQPSRVRSDGDSSGGGYTVVGP